MTTNDRIKETKVTQVGVEPGPLVTVERLSVSDSLYEVVLKQQCA